mmetsp:Transcript_112146/g.229596  ORF Transcript_112146/g.229596 Transcript_112146/m.229596 type:complete len:89 (-) Transcript_112146:190-456(-)
MRGAPLSSELLHYFSGLLGRFDHFVAFSTLTPLQTFVERNVQYNHIYWNAHRTLSGGFFCQLVPLRSLALVEVASIDDWAKPLLLRLL